MKKWNSFYEYVKVPLQLILVILLIQNITGLILSRSFFLYWDISNTIYQDVAQIILNFTTRILEATPLLIGMHLLYKRFNASLPALALLALVVLNYSFSEILIYPNSTFAGLLVPSHLFAAGTTEVLLLGLLVAYFYRVSQSRSKYSFMSFISRDFWFILNIFIFGSVVIGAWMFILPYLLNFSEFIVKLIAYDISNPISLFFYGTLERVFTLLNVSRLIQIPFLFSSAGGAWIDTVGNNFVGDVAIWTAQTSHNIFNTGIGRFITPNYIITLFIVPAIIFSIYQKSKDKIDRKKSLIVLIILSVFSLFGNSLLPIELLLLFMAPTLLIFHYVYVGVLYALLPMLNVFIGYISTNKTVFSVGNLLDLFVYSKHPEISAMLPALISVGVVSFVIYYLVFEIYYNKFALDLFQTGRQETIIAEFVEIIGGLNNIKLLTNTAFAINVRFNDDHLVDFHRLNEVGVIKIRETRFGYCFVMGAGSYIISKSISKQLKK